MSKIILTGLVNLTAATIISLSLFFTLHATLNIKQQLVGRHQVFNLSKEVNEKTVSGLLYLLQTATSDDDITIYINSPGGSVEAGMPVLKAMQESKANHIEAVVTGMAASMAEGIALESDHITMKPGTQLMFHYGSVGSKVLTESDMKSKNVAIANYMVLMDGLLHTQGDKFITKGGWSTIHKGGLYWLSDKEFKDLGGDGFNGRRVENVYIQQVIDFINGFESNENSIIFTWITKLTGDK